MSAQAADALSASTVGRDSLFVAVWTLASRVSGLLRVAVVAAVLGPTFLGNIYQSTTLLPQLLYSLMAGPLVGALIVPTLVRYVDSDRERSRRFINAALGHVLVAFTIGGAAAIVGGTIITELLTLGVTGDAHGDAVRVAWILLLLLVPQVLLYGVIGVAVAAQHSRGRFGLAAAAPITENAGIVVTMVLVVLMFGRGQSVETASDGLLVLLGAGTTLSVITHAAVQWAAARAAGFNLCPAIDWSHPDVRAFRRMAFPTMGTTSLNTARLLAVTIVAGLVPGGVVAMQMGMLFATFPVAIGARPISQALLPRLARLRTARDPRLADEYNGALGAALLVGVPSAIGLIGLSAVIAPAVAFGEMATPRGIELLRFAIAAFGAAVIGASVNEIVRQAAYSDGDARGPFLVSLLRMAIMMPGILIAATLLDGAASIAALGLTGAVADGTGAVVLERRTRKGMPGRGRLLVWVARDLLFAVLAVAAALLGVAAVDAMMPDGRIEDSVILIVAVTAGVLTYASAQLATGLPELAPLGIDGRRLSRVLSRRSAPKEHEPSHSA